MEELKLWDEVKLRDLSNEKLLDTAAATHQTLEYYQEQLDQLRAERDAHLADVNRRINEAGQEEERAETAHQEVMKELGTRMLAHKVRTIRDWRGTFHLEGVPEGALPQAHFVAGDGGQVSWLDWTAMDAYPEAGCTKDALVRFGDAA